MIVAFADRSSRTHRRHQRRRSSNSSSKSKSKNSKTIIDDVPYDKRQSGGSSSSQRSQRSCNKKNTSSRRRNQSYRTRCSSGSGSGSSSKKKTHKSAAEKNAKSMVDELDKYIPPALKEQDVKKSTDKNKVVKSKDKGKEVSETRVYKPRRRESTDDPRISWGSSVLRPGMQGRRDSQSSVGSEVIVEFPKERRRPSYNSTGSSGRVITDNLSLVGFMKRSKNKGGSITGISISDRTSSSCPAKPQHCTDRRCHHNKRTHTSTRHFKHAVDWRSSSIDWGDSTDDEGSSMCNTVDGSDDDDDDDDGSEFCPQRIRRARDPAGHYSGRNLLDRSVYSDVRLESSENTGRTLSESFSSLLSGTFRKPDP